MKLLLVRHPVTLANIEGRVNIDCEEKIVPLGYEQISKTVERLKEFDIEALYSSDARRCVELANAIALGIRIEPEIYPVFREIDNGEMNGLPKERVSGFRKSNPSNARIPGGESLEDLENRSKEGLEIMVAGKKDRIVLVSHGMYLKIFVGRLLGIYPKAAMSYFKFSNCSVSEIDITDEGVRLNYLNDKCHLK